MRSGAWFLCAASLTVLLAGCVERRYVVTTEPPGAIVLRNGQPIGASPVDDHFIYYGNYHFTIVKDGFETLQVDQNIPAPWYEWPVIDFFTENLLPWTILDRREFHYQLQPKRIVNTNDLLRDAQNLRNRGLSLGSGSALPGTPTPGAPPAEPAAAPPSANP